MAKLELLKPKIRGLAERLINECKNLGYQVTITQTLRTIEEQDALYAQGRTKPGNIVTKAKGGYSLHNFGVAFDICPIVNGKAAWNDTALFKKIGEIGVSLGLEWGGTWTSFPDLPHFQYLAGHSLADFRNNKVDWKKFVGAMKKNKADAMKFIKGKNVCIYGASTKGNTIAQYYGMNSKNIVCAIDKSKEKWGKYMVGTNIPILPEENLSMFKYAFVMPYGFINLFKEREKKWLAQGGKFLTPFPEFKQIGNTKRV